MTATAPPVSIPVSSGLSEAEAGRTFPSKVALAAICALATVLYGWGICGWWLGCSA